MSHTTEKLTERYGLTTPVTGDELYEAMYQAHIAGRGYTDEQQVPILEMLRAEAYDPASLLGYNTTACPSFCSGKHDRGNFEEAYTIHPGPEVLRVAYDGSPNTVAPGWTVQLAGYEYVNSPGKVQPVIEVGGDPDGLHPTGIGWNFEITPEQLRQLASIVGQVDELLGGAA